MSSPLKNKGLSATAHHTQTVTPTPTQPSGPPSPLLAPHLAHREFTTQLSQPSDCVCTRLRVCGRPSPAPRRRQPPPPQSSPLAPTVGLLHAGGRVHLLPHSATLMSECGRHHVLVLVPGLLHAGLNLLIHAFSTTRYGCEHAGSAAAATSRSWICCRLAACMAQPAFGVPFFFFGNLVVAWPLVGLVLARHAKRAVLIRLTPHEKCPNRPCLGRQPGLVACGGTAQQHAGQTGTCPIGPCCAGLARCSSLHFALILSIYQSIIINHPDDSV